MLTLPPPPALRGTADEKIAQLSSYLYQLVEALNINFQSNDDNPKREE